MNQGTSPLWALNKQKSKEKSQADGNENFSLFIRLLYGWSLVWRVSFQCVAVVKLCSTSWAVVHSKKFVSQEQSRHFSRYSESLSMLGGHTRLHRVPKGDYNMDAKSQLHRHVQGIKKKLLNHPCSEPNGTNPMSVELRNRPGTVIPATSTRGEEFPTYSPNRTKGKGGEMFLLLNS